MTRTSSPARRIVGLGLAGAMGRWVASWFAARFAAESSHHQPSHPQPPRIMGLRLLRLWPVMLAAVLLGGCASSSHFERWGAGTPVHLVARGDTLYSVAVENDLDWRDLARWNGIRDPRQLRVGQTLRLTPPRRLARTKPTASVQHGARKHSEHAGGRHQHKHPSKAVAQARKASSTQRASRRHPVDYQSRSPSRWHWPVQGKILSRYKPSDPAHKGIVLGGKMGEVVRASAAGEVVYAGNGLPGYGNLVIIKHSETMLTAYAYNQRLLVHEDQHVKARQAIATMGHPPGRGNADKPSLLFQIRRNGKPVDPLHYLPAH